jgi:4-amino-4-deoxy-L-arabinose transferase-like glycosyltransferase
MKIRTAAPEPGAAGTAYGRLASASRVKLVLICLLLWLPGFFTLPPGDRDESRFAQATKQMIETGDYVRIMNGAEARNRKPIGIYWLQVPFVVAVGPGLANPIWPYRVPSLLGGIGAVLAVFEIGLMAGLGRRAAWLAAAMLAGCVILTVETHIAKTDAALLGTTTIVMAILAGAWMGAPVGRWQAALFWVAAAAGILIKGPITPMVAGLAALTLCAWEKRARWLLVLQPVWGVPLLLTLVLPWFVAILAATHGKFFADAVGGDLGRKLAGGAETHGGFPGLHLLLLPLLAFPYSIPVLCGLAAAWRARQDRFVRFLIAWVAPCWLVFEAVPTKLPHYTLPLYPALFLLAARFFTAAGPTLPGWVPAAGRAGLLLAGTGLAAAAAVLPIYLHGSWWLGLPAASCCGLVIAAGYRGRLLLTLAASVPLYAAILQLELPHLPALWIAPRVETALRRTWPDWNTQGDGLAVAGYAEPSLMFLAGTNLKLLGSGSEAARALAAGRAERVLVSNGERARFDDAARQLGLKTQQQGEVSGFNYSRGRWLSLNLLAVSR